MTEKETALAESIYASLITSSQLRNFDWADPPARAQAAMENMAHFAETAAKAFYTHLAEHDKDGQPLNTRKLGDPA